MDSFSWQCESTRSETAKIVVGGSIAAVVYGVLFANMMPTTGWKIGVGAFVVAWVCFSVFRSRPRQVKVFDHSLYLSNQGTYSIEGLKVAKIRRLLGVEKSLYFKTAEGGVSIALHGMPEAMQQRLVQVLNQRIAT